MQTLTFPNSLMVIPFVQGENGYVREIAIDKIYGPIIKKSYLSDDEKLNEALEQIVKEVNLDKEGKGFSLYKMANDEVLGFLYNDNSKTLIIGTIIILLSIMGLIIVFLGEINKRKSEMGVKLAVGATLKDLKKELFLEVFSITIISSLLSFIFMYLVVQIININLSFLLMNLILNIFITTIITIVILFKIRNLKVVELIKSKK